MAVTNHERVDNALDLLRAGLGPFVEREIKAAMKDGVSVPALQTLANDQLVRDRPIVEWDAALLLKVMWESWNEVFRRTLGPAERGLVGEMRGHRNKWAHQEPFSSDDTYRALDSAGRLLTAISAPQSRDLERIKMELLRVRFDEQARNEKRKSAGTAIESQATGSLNPWREVVSPHRDVASGRYQQAEFAADLWQVHIGEGTDEYKKPVEFFPPDVPDGKSEATADRRDPSPFGGWRRSGHPAADQFRRRQDPFHAGPIPPVLRDQAKRVARH